MKLGSAYGGFLRQSARSSVEGGLEDDRVPIAGPYLRAGEHGSASAIMHGTPLSQKQCRLGLLPHLRMYEST